MYENLSKQELNAMVSDEYKQHFEGSNGDDFRKRVSELENAPRQATRQAGSVRPADAPAPAQTFDPSFDGDEQPAAPAAAAVAPAPAPVAATETEIVREYQPTTKDGKPIGGKQVFRGKTVEEVLDKVIEAHKAASARIRILSRDRKLDEIATAGATPRTQPEKEVPNTVEGLAAELKAQREQNFLLSVREALNGFQLSVDWSKYRSNENAQSVVLAVQRANDDPTDVQSYFRAFNNMKAFLEPVVPAAAPAPAPAPVPVVAAPAPAVRSTRTVGVPTGLSHADGGESYEPAAPLNNGPKFYTAAELDRMPSDQMKKLLRDPRIAQKINAVYEEAAARR